MLTYVTANVEDGAHLDISAAGFWGGGHQKAFLTLRFSIQMFPAIGDHRFLPCTTGFGKDKWRRYQYEQRIWEVELASFTPSVFRPLVVWVTALMSYIRGSNYLFSLKNLDYSNVMAWLCWCLSFPLLWSAIACLLGAWFHCGCLTKYGALDQVLAEGQVHNYAHYVHI